MLSAQAGSKLLLEKIHGSYSQRISSHANDPKKSTLVASQTEPDIAINSNFSKVVVDDSPTLSSEHDAAPIHTVYCDSKYL